jgi:L-threonylcarbamoyladenylate synthase
METLELNGKNYKEVLKIATKAIKDGKVLICPTDTVYGLICNFFNKKAIDKIYKIKKRPKSKLLPVFIKDIKMAKGLVKIDKNQGKFLKKIWPGAVTVILEKNKNALRIPKNKFVLDLIKRASCPLAETSANLSGKEPAMDLKEIMSYFKNRKIQPDLVISVGKLKKSRPSKIIDLTVFPFKVIRK